MVYWDSSRLEREMINKLKLNDGQYFAHKRCLEVIETSFPRSPKQYTMYTEKTFSDYYQVDHGSGPDGHQVFFLFC